MRVEQLRVVGGCWRVAAAQLQRRRSEEIAQHGQLVGRRALVHAVEHGMPVLGQELRRADIRRQHAFFDQLVRIVARRGNDLRDLAVLVEFQREFDGVEVDGATLVPRRRQCVIERVQILQVRQQFTRLGIGGLRRGIEPLPHLRVREPGARMHDRRIERVALDCAGRRHFHVADHAKTVDAAFERAQLVRQLLRQHRDYAPREIDGRSALARVAVDRIAVAHVVRDIGDRDDRGGNSCPFARNRRRRRSPWRFRRRW